MADWLSVLFWLMHSSATHNSYAEIQIMIFIAEASKANIPKMLGFFLNFIYKKEHG